MIETPRSTRRRPDDSPCQNCGDPTHGRFCPACGQRKADVRVSLHALFSDVVQDELVLNRALPRTLVGLLFRPGFLTAEYVRGRVVRYIPPFRLYLVASVLFFLLISFIGLRAVDRVTMTVDGARVAIDADSVSLAGAGLDSAALAAIDRFRGTHPNAPGTMQPWAEDLTVSSPIPLIERALERKVAQVGHLPPALALRAVAADMLEYAPHMVFVLLPVFALLLKLLYVRRDHYYAEHFVFALHVHAFVFVMFLVMLALPWGRVRGIILLWMMLYIWLAMKRVYGQGWFRTTAKWAVLGWSYSFVLLIGLLGLTVATLVFT